MATTSTFSVYEISDFERYEAIVFGSGVYDGSWTAEATELMRRHAAVLARKPVWLFSVGSFGDRPPIVGGLMKKEPKEIGGSCSKVSAVTRVTTASGLTSMLGRRQSRRPYGAGKIPKVSLNQPINDLGAPLIEDRVRLVHNLSPGNENFRRG
jgi:hypothetical protein